MSRSTLAKLRREYTAHILDESHAPASPFSLFRLWFAESVRSKLPEPNACILATVGDRGLPAARAVLLKDFGSTGFTFFTNYESRKGRELLENPRAAMTFLWAELERQVRIEGRVEKVSRAASARYFAQRPRGSQLAAWVSAQSRVVSSRESLERAYVKLEQEFRGRPIPCPLHWGGFRLIPVSFEFWQGRKDRLHDRVRYRFVRRGRWRRERLAP